MLLLCFYFEGYIIGTSGAALGFAAGVMLHAISTTVSSRQAAACF